MSDEVTHNLLRMSNNFLTKIWECLDKLTKQLEEIKNDIRTWKFSVRDSNK